MTEQFADANGIKICYSDHGDGFPIILIHGVGAKKETWIAQIDELSKKYKVSSEVYLRRLKDLNLISRDRFFELLDIIRSKVKPSKKGGFAVSQIQKSINARGQLFCYSVINAAKNEVITYNRASDILGIKVNYILAE